MCHDARIMSCTTSGYAMHPPSILLRGPRARKLRNRHGVYMFFGLAALCIAAVVLIRDTHGHTASSGPITARIPAHVRAESIDGPLAPSPIPAVRSTSSDCGSYGYCQSQRYVAPSHRTRRAHY
jgi:hypothetical protein